MSAMLNFQKESARKIEMDSNNTLGPTIVEEKINKSNGDTQINKYIKGRFLGKGGFAKCYEFTNIENKAITAAKIVVKSSLTRSRAK
jgi:polo-like kinase 1